MEKFKALTPTILGQYIYHNCERQVYYHLLPDEDPRKPVKVEMDSRLRVRGLEHEKRVLQWYYRQGLQIVEVKGPDAAEQTRELIREGKADLIYQAYLYPAGLFRQVYAHLPVMVHGYPDLLKKRTDKTTPDGHAIYEVGDIKASLQPKLYQKYQVTLYSHLLYFTYRSLYPGETLYYPERGFIVPLPNSNPQEVGNSGSEVWDPGLYSEESFDLEPFRYALEDVFKEIARILSKDLQEAAWHLDFKCGSCGYFKHCQEEARRKADLSLIPFLRRSQKRRLLRDGITTVDQAATSLDPSAYREDWILSRSARQIQLHAQALKENRIIVKESVSHLIPHNIQVEIYIQVDTDPVQQILYLYGLLVRESGKEDRLEIFLASRPEEERQTFERFLICLHQIWKDCQDQGKMAHIFLYDSYEKRQLQRIWEKYFLGEWEKGGTEEWGSGRMGELRTLLQQLIFNAQGHYANLHQVLQQTLALPVESAYTLPQVARVLGYSEPGLQFDENPESLSLPQLYWQTTDPIQRSQYQDQMLARVAFNLLATAHIYGYLRSTLTWPRAKTSMALEPLPGEWTSLKGKLLTFLKTERDLKIQEIRQFQRLSVSERVAQYRCIAMLKFLNTQILPSGRQGYVFSYGASGAQSKFRDNEFLRLNPMGPVQGLNSELRISNSLQGGQSVILVRNDPRKLQLVLIPRGKGPLVIDPQARYTLDEDLDDFTFSKVWHAVNRAFSENSPFNFFDLLNGKYGGKENTSFRSQAMAWMEPLRKVLDFDSSQEQAFLLPFTYDLSLIQGPPGTGKTHVLAWILIAQILLAQREQRPLRILVSAGSHKAINNVLSKVASHLNTFMGGQALCPLYKLNSAGGEAEELNPEIELSNSRQGVRVQEIGRWGRLFPQDPYYILGATPQGIYSAVKDKNYWTSGDAFESLFDLVVFDEASQVTVPLAILAMLYGKGRFLFVGDENQMPPIVQGTYPEEEYYHRSIFEYLKSRTGYRSCTVMLTQTRRMNKELTEFPSLTFYYNRLKPHPQNAQLKLPTLKSEVQSPKLETPKDPKPWASRIDEILDPLKPVVLVEMFDDLSQQRNLLEAELIVDLTRRLVLDYQIPPQNLAIITPHRAQNNEIITRLTGLFQTQQIEMEERLTLSLPLVDTVERIQGQEREVILISLTASDPDYILAESEFLLSPNRLNVALTRAARKLIVIGSQTVFQVRPEEESLLRRAMFLKKFRRFCERKKAIVSLLEPHRQTLPP
ncbi:MAG TPA: AAA domain-containing protein [Candidatus Limnocylindrales bacterium]|nr:AAA domain-containing protein [Candidatus Limnocylindrales bacterium]